MVRRIDVPPDHIGSFLLKIRVVGRHVSFKPVRLQAGALPRLADQIVMNLQHAPQLPCTPVRTPVWRRLSRLRHDPRFHGGGQHPPPPAPGPRAPAPPPGPAGTATPPPVGTPAGPGRRL